MTKDDLASLFEVLPRLSTPAEKVEWLSQIFQWLRSPVQLSGPEAEARRATGVQAVRLRFLFQLLERNATWKRDASAALGEIFEQGRLTGLLADTGFSEQTGLLGEVLDRLGTKFVPQVVETSDLRWVARQVFPTEEDAEWFEECPSETRDECLALVAAGFKDPAGTNARMERVVGEALLLIGARIAALGSSAGLRRLRSIERFDDSPFLRLQQSLAALVRGDRKLRPVLLENISRHLLSAHAEVELLRRALETHGVSIAIVFQLEQLSLGLTRVAVLANIHVDGQASDIFALCAELIRTQEDERGFRGLLSRNFQLFSRKIVERTGASGEHYITRSRDEYRRMIFTAMGGGALTTVTTLAKYALKPLTHVPFLEGLLAGLNYAISFVSLQLMHLTLATKQPSMTAAALAAKIPGDEVDLERNPELFTGFVTEIVYFLRSQTAALFGNISAALPSAWLVAWAWSKLFSRPFLDTGTAEYALRSLDPFTTLTWAYAAMTGVLLWLSSVFAGAFENWIVYRRIPLAISTNPFLLRRWNAEKLRRAGDWLTKNASGLAGSVSLGFLLGFFPVFARFFGLPLDVRHVTLSTCQLALGLTALGWENVDGWLLARLGLGILGIGFLNLSVSFSLAAFVALRARKVGPAKMKSLLFHVRRRFVRRPFFFLLPLGDPNQKLR